MAAGTMTGSPPLSTGKILSTLGAVTAGFSALASLLVLFVLPGRCTFLGGLELVLLGFLFIAGLITLLVGRIVLRREGNLE